jgi:hypothetical protein
VIELNELGLNELGEYSDDRWVGIDGIDGVSGVECVECVSQSVSSCLDGILSVSCCLLSWDGFFFLGVQLFRPKKGK